MLDEKEQQLVRSLQECMIACNHCLNECLAETHVEMMLDCIRLDRECAEFCSYLEQAVIRKSPFVHALTSLCISICEACAKECQKHEHRHCQYCAEICTQCLAVCKNYLQ
ncbi:four-helix bundle copper-binding protein [Niallia sp. NCCP-28]|uniref:four-helix bundle copper-binding protein n=1 Tax=Niallia sp. NCCP-28 TaxID=2934712 RepID=UPI0020893FD7|nr:four-helix bundle copper-binding protein [Niallia sp. NCCP-28]GKU85190.1 putative cysteine-rich protein YhjQ [Niallia sp. NCCP-28]